MNASPLPSAVSGKLEQFPPVDGRKMAQVSGAGTVQERKRTARLKQTMPAGISIGVRTDGRQQPWYVRFGVNRKVESFAREEDRNDRAQELANAITNEGAGVLSFDPEKWKKLLRFEQRTGVSIEEAEDIVLRVKGNLRLNLSTDEAVARYMDLRIKEGFSKLSVIHPRLHLKRFCEHLNPDKTRLGVLPLFAITPEHIRHWLEALKGQGFGPVTLRHHRKNLNVFFERAKLEKWCVENPCNAVTPPKVQDVTASILSPKEIFHLLKANWGYPVAGRLVLELFGGMRCASVERVLAEHVKVDRRGIEMPGAQHKSGKRKYRQGHPGALWEWIGHASPQCFEEITEANYDEKKKAAFVRAGWEQVPHNRLRHCCASYLLAFTKNPPFVAYLLQHTSLKMLERYEGIADEYDARLVLSMSPLAVLMDWEDFLKRWPEHYEPMAPALLASTHR